MKDFLAANRYIHQQSWFCSLFPLVPAKSKVMTGASLSSSISNQILNTSGQVSKEAVVKVYITEITAEGRAETVLIINQSQICTPSHISVTWAGGDDGEDRSESVTLSGSGDAHARLCSHCRNAVSGNLCVTWNRRCPLKQPDEFRWLLSSSQLQNQISCRDCVLLWKHVAFQRPQYPSVFFFLLKMCAHPKKAMGIVSYLVTENLVSERFSFRFGAKFRPPNFGIFALEFCLSALRWWCMCLMRGSAVVVSGWDVRGFIDQQRESCVWPGHNGPHSPASWDHTHYGDSQRC